MSNRYILSRGIGDSRVLVYRQRKSGGVSETLRVRACPKTKWKPLGCFLKVKSKTLFKLKPEDLIY